MTDHGANRVMADAVGEVLMASPAISDGVLFVRGLKNLFAIDGTTGAAPASKPATGAAR